MIVIDAPPEKQLTQGWRRDEGLRLEAEDYFCKPLKASALVPVVEKLLDETTRKIKVLVADDHAVVREGIRALVTLQKDMKIIGEAIDGKDAVDKVVQLVPDVVLMDIVMPGMSGIEATRRSTKMQQSKVLMLSQYDDEENVLASTQAGAFAFIPKRVPAPSFLMPSGLQDNVFGNFLKGGCRLQQVTITLNGRGKRSSEMTILELAREAGITIHNL